MFKGFSFKYAISIIIGYIAIFFSPVIYLGLTCGSGWWPLFSSIVVAFVQVVAIFIILGLLSDDMISIKEQHSPLAGGLLCGLSICGLLFWLIFPSLVGYTHLFENTFYYYGFYRQSESPSIISIVFFLIAVCVYLMLITGSLEVAGLKVDKDWSTIRSCPSFMKGLLFSISFFVLIGFISYMLPVHVRISYSRLVKQQNEKIDSINKRRMEIKETRSKEVRALSFADFRLGSSIDSCIQVINSSYEYSLLSNDKVKDMQKAYSIAIEDVDYSTVFDSLLYVSYEWDNEPTIIGLYCRQNRLLAIQFQTTHELDSLVSMFTQKYGETEILLPRKDELSDSYSYFLYERYDALSFVEPIDNVANKNMWTFKNSLIYIYNQDYQNCFVIYFDRSCEDILKALQDKIEQERQIQEERRSDSIRRVIEYEQRLRDSEERMKERKHREFLEKI